MQLTEITYASATPIDGYGPGFFRVGGTILRGSVCLTAEKAMPWSGLQDTSVASTLSGQIDVLLLGTGSTMQPVPADLRQACENAGIGVEPMSSPSACRTYNVLLSEGRRVAVALLPV